MSSLVVNGGKIVYFFIFVIFTPWRDSNLMRKNILFQPHFLAILLRKGAQTQCKRKFILPSEYFLLFLHPGSGKGT